MIDQDDIIDFLRQNGGRVTNIELYVAFKVCVTNVTYVTKVIFMSVSHLPNF